MRSVYRYRRGTCSRSSPSCATSMFRRGMRRMVRTITRHSASRADGSAACCRMSTSRSAWFQRPHRASVYPTMRYKVRPFRDGPRGSTRVPTETQIGVPEGGRTALVPLAGSSLATSSTWTCHPSPRLRTWCPPRMAPADHRAAAHQLTQARSRPVGPDGLAALQGGIARPDGGRGRCPACFDFRVALWGDLGLDRHPRDSPHGIVALGLWEGEHHRRRARGAGSAT